MHGHFTVVCVDKKLDSVGLTLRYAHTTSFDVKLDVDSVRNPRQKKFHSASHLFNWEIHNVVHIANLRCGKKRSEMSLL